MPNYRRSILRRIQRVHHWSVGLLTMSMSSGGLSTLGQLGHVTPEAQLGGPIALVKDGDRIVIDGTTRQIDWQVDDETKVARRKEWEAQGKRDLKVNRGVLYRYARDVAVSSDSSPSPSIPPF